MAIPRPLYMIEQRESNPDPSSSSFPTSVSFSLRFSRTSFGNHSFMKLTIIRPVMKVG
jgi:hypothetical protein